MAELHDGQASRDALTARLESPVAKKSLNDLAHMLVQSVLEVMSPDLLPTLDTEEAMAAFREAWPDFVRALLFRGDSERQASAGRRNAAKKTVKRKRVPAMSACGCAM